MKDYKDTIIKILKFLITREKFNNEPYKVRAYEKVLVQIEDHDHVYSMEDLEDVEGIGLKIKAKLEEIFKTGTFSEYSKYAKTDLSIAYKELLQIYGIGPKKAKELIGMGIYSIYDLRKAAFEIPDLLNESQNLGLTFYEDSIERIPRTEMKLHENFLKLKSRKFSLKPEITGSYRRNMPSSGDIDCLVHYENFTSKEAVENFNNYIDDLIDFGYIVGVLSRGNKKCLCFVKIKKTIRRADFLLTTPEEYPYALLYFTGSREFNISMRKHALELGYSLSEHSLLNIETKKKVHGLETEQDIFDYLGLEYVQPKNRI